MKKISLATLVALAFAASACGGGNPSSQNDSNDRGGNPDPTPTVTVTVTPGPNPTPTVTVTVTPTPWPTYTGTPIRPEPILPPILPIAYPEVGSGGTVSINDPTGASTVTQSFGTQGASCSTVQECAQNSAAVAQVASAFTGLETQAEGTVSDSVGGGTKDVDQESAQADQADQENRAQGIANSFGMDYSKALELTRLADQVQSLSKSNQMTTEDQDAITQKALSVAGISSDDVNGAVAQVVKTGDQTAIDGLMTKAATNLGMPSSAGLREQILPALGIRF